MYFIFKRTLSEQSSKISPKNPDYLHIPKNSHPPSISPFSLCKNRMYGSKQTGIEVNLPQYFKKHVKKIAEP